MRVDSPAAERVRGQVEQRPPSKDRTPLTTDESQWKGLMKRRILVVDDDTADP